MPLEKVYRTGGANITSSLDGWEIATGVGFITFYFNDLQTGSDVVGYVLTENSMFSTSGTFGVGGVASIVKDFDLSFLGNVTAKGHVSFNLPLTATGGSPMVTVQTLKLYKVDIDGTETQLGDTVTQTRNAAAAEYMFSGEFTMPKTNFKNGEKLRTEITLTTNTAGHTLIMEYGKTQTHSLSNEATINIPIILPR